MDPTTTTKASGSSGIEVFKHHWSERAPTERYDYDFSTAVFTRTDDLSTLKYTAATQEDCGASFKQAWVEGGGWAIMESVYFPEAGPRSLRKPGALPLPHEALTLVLRDLAARAGGPDDEPLPAREIELLPTQADTHRVRWETETLRLVHAGAETLDTALGPLATQAFRLEEPSEGRTRARYWFAAEGEAPLLHLLVRYADARGVEFELIGLDRYPYWERGPKREQ